MDFYLWNEACYSEDLIKTLFPDTARCMTCERAGPTVHVTFVFHVSS